MKSLHKITTLFIVVLTIAASVSVPAVSSAQTTSQSCNTWSLVWSDTQQPVDPNSANDFLTPPSPTTVTVPEDGATTSTGPIGLDTWVALGATINTASTTHAGANPSWACGGGTATGNGFLSPSEQANPPGTESCVAAVEIAQKYAWYTSAGSSQQIVKNIGALILPKIQNLLTGALGNLHIDMKSLISGDTLKSIFGSSSISVNQLSSFFNGGDVQGLLQKVMTNPNNPLIKGAQQGLTEAQTYVKQELAKIGLQVAGQLENQAKNVLQLSTVPVSDQGVQSAINQTTEAVRSVQAQQEKDQVIASTRARCDLLLKQTVETIKRSLLYQFTTETVDWIQGGGIQVGSNGKITLNPPQYFQRPLKDLADAGLNAVDNIISQVAPQLCQPFRLAVTLQIPTTNRQANPFYQQASCTLNQVVSNIQNFYSNFRSGGWLGYQEIWMPQNNYYGASLITQQLAAQARAAATQATQNQINQSGGYKNTYMCTEWDEYKEQPAYYCAPGVPNTVLDTGTGKCYALNNSFANPNGISEPSDASTTITDTAFIEGDKYFTSADRSMYYQCASSIVTQPSNIASGLAQQASQVDTNAIINAQDLTDIGSIIQNAIINKLTKVGIGGIRGLLQNLPAISEKWQILKP